jgi:hypothetical protein
MIIPILISTASSFAVGVLIEKAVGKRSKKNKSQIQIAKDNAIQTQTILLDADSNRDIAEIVRDSPDSKTAQTLEELTRVINLAAENGQTFVYIVDDFDLNNKIRDNLTRKEVSNFLKNRKYKFTFMYDSLEYSDIEKIWWW